MNCMSCEKKIDKNSHHIILYSPTKEIKLEMCRNCYNDAYEEIKVSYTINTMIKKLREK